MKYLFFILLPVMAYADGGVCKKCELVREFNEKHPSKYEFYEDYLKDKKAGVAEDIRFTDEEANSPSESGIKPNLK